MDPRKGVGLAALLFLLGPTGPAAAALVVEAETAGVQTEGGPSGDGWNLWSNGTVGEYVSISTGGRFRLVAVCYGSPVDGVWPLMAPNIDTISLNAVPVETNVYTEFEFEFELVAGVHLIGVAFLNDDMSAVEDRNLYLDRFELHPPAGQSDPLIVSEADWNQNAELRENQAVDESQAGIRTHRMGPATVQVVDAVSNPIPEAVVSVEQLTHEFMFGANLFGFDQMGTPERNELYRQHFHELFNYATLPFYWISFDDAQGNPDYARIDQMAAWAAQYGIRLKGHPLLWDHEAGIPPWSVGQPTVEQQQARVVEIISRYEGVIEFWEVVNEPGHLDGIPIDDPYRWARDTSSTANLIVNDYEVEYNGYYPFLALLERAIADQVPFDGIGIQAHEPRDVAFPLDRIKTILDAYATLGKALHITEFTPVSSGIPVSGAPWRDAWDEAQQADYAEKFYRVVFAHPAMVGITWWDVCDAGSWLQNGGLLREDLTPKPVYTALQQLIHQEWHTFEEGASDFQGQFGFSGFYGSYRVTATLGDDSESAQFQLVRDHENVFILELPDVHIEQDGGVDGDQMDAGGDPGQDAGTDASVDAGTDAGVDAGADAGVDAGTPDGAANDAADAGVGDPGQFGDPGDSETDEPANGCGCSAPDKGAGTVCWIPIGILVLLVRRRFA